MDGAGEGGAVEGVSLLIVAVPGCGRKTLSESLVGAITFSIPCWITSEQRFCS